MPLPPTAFTSIPPTTAAIVSMTVVLLASACGVLVLARRGAGHGRRLPRTVRTTPAGGVRDRDLRRAVCDATLLLTGATSVQLWELDGRSRLLVTASAGEPPALRSVPLGDLPVTEASQRVAVAMGKRLTAFEAIRAGDRIVGLLAAGSDESAPRPSLTMRLLAAQIGEHVERNRLSAEITTDPLTGLTNRRGFESALQRELSRARRQDLPLSLAVVDLDRFKAINDSLGHAAGDLALRAASTAWPPALRDTDLLARTGGDEFAVLLPSCPAEEAVRVLERVRAGTPLALTCSIGVATLAAGEAAPELFARADAALYAAKRAGRDRVHVAPTHLSAALDHLDTGVRP